MPVASRRAAGAAAMFLAVMWSTLSVGRAAERPAQKTGGGATADAEDLSKAVVEGVVVDEAGKPVADAEVATLVAASAEATPARSRADGSFRLVLAGASARYSAFRASADEGARQGMCSFQDTVLRRVARVRIVLKPSRTVVVRVTDSDNTALAGAAVGAIDESLHLLAQAESGSRGNAVLRFPADAKLLQVAALKPRVGFDYYENYRAWPGAVIGEPPANVHLTLDGVRSVTVRATDSAGKPLAGVRFVPWTVQKRGKLTYANLSGAPLGGTVARTDQDGVATLDWLPKQMEGGMTLLHSNEEYHLPAPPHWDPVHPEEPLVAKMYRNVPLSGKLTLPDGKPAGGILVQVEGRGKTNHYFRNVVRTKADGTYALPVYPDQSYIVAITDDDWAAPSKTGLFVREGETAAGVDFRLGKGTLLRGRVTAGKDRKPAAGETVTLMEQDNGNPPNPGGGGVPGSLVRWAQTDGEGRYSIRLGSGEYQINGPGRQAGQQNLVIKQEEVVERAWHMDRPTWGILKGVVRAYAADGKPVAKAVASLTWSYFSNAKAVADDKGRFEMRRMLAEGFLHVRNPEGTLAVIAPVGPDEEEVQVLLADAGALRGRLLDKQGKPVEGVRISCDLQIGPADKPFAHSLLYATSDAAGCFTLTGIVSGVRCRLTAFDNKTFQTLKELPATRAEVLDLGDFAFEVKE